MATLTAADGTRRFDWLRVGVHFSVDGLRYRKVARHSGPEGDLRNAQLMPQGGPAYFEGWQRVMPANAPLQGATRRAHR